MAKNKNKVDYVGLGLLGGAGYLIYSFIKPKEENEQELFLAGGGGSSSQDVPLDLGGTGLTREQETFISQALSNSQGTSTFDSYTINGENRNIITTNKKNKNSFASRENIGNFENSNLFVAFTDDRGEIVGGADFINMQSTTASRAKKSISNPETIKNLNKGILERTSKSNNKISSSSSGSNFINSITSGSSSSSSKKKKKVTFGDEDKAREIFKSKEWGRN